MGETYWELIDGVASQAPERVLVADDHGRTLTTAEFRDAAEQVAAALLQAGVEPGGVVSWQLPTTLEAAVLMGACARAGVVQNPVIPVLRHREVGHISGQVGTTLFVTATTWRGFDHRAMADDLGLTTWALDLETDLGAGLLLPTADPSDLPPPPTNADECRWIYYSSGTTADPKGVRHTDASVIASPAGMVERLGFGESDVYPVAWPFSHIGGVGMLTSALRTGMRLVLFDTFDPMTSPERMAAHGVTMLNSATPFFRAFLDAEARHGSEPLFTAVRGCVGGGATIPGAVNQELVETFGVAGVVGAYGLTELPNATCEWPDDPLIGTTVGPPAPGVEARIVDGELQLRGPQCFLGYVDTSLDAAAFAGDGWFRTGDLASVDESGRITIVGRLKDVIIRNAENISATEVEEAVLHHPAVLDVAVVGLPDDRTGERVCAAVVLAPGADLDVATLGAHCAALGLARYKCPEQIVPVEAIERNPMGKVAKVPLREKLLGATRAG